jgi:hypothetical protein
MLLMRYVTLYLSIIDVYVADMKQITQDLGLFFISHNMLTITAEMVANIRITLSLSCWSGQINVIYNICLGNN